MVSGQEVTRGGDRLARPPERAKVGCTGRVLKAGGQVRITDPTADDLGGRAITILTMQVHAGRKPQLRQA
jgi:hypothetical protein